MIFQALIFYLFAGITIASAVMVISARNPVHSVLFLILAFFNAAGLFILLGAEFLAMILVVVYVGAVAVLFLFVVMMLDISFVQLREGVHQYLPIGGLIAIVIVAEVLVALSGWHFSAENAHFGAPTPAMDQVHNTAALGQLVYTHYIYLFQAAGLILLVAMIGAIVLTHRKRPGVRKQNINTQVNTRAEEVVKVRKIQPGSGV
ncbi:MAG: NADH-quinone oxidoreductase subunit J [Magnetospiraceae bacterium]